MKFVSLEPDNSCVVPPPGAVHRRGGPGGGEGAGSFRRLHGEGRGRHDLPGDRQGSPDRQVPVRAGQRSPHRHHGLVGEGQPRQPPLNGRRLCPKRTHDAVLGLSCSVERLGASCLLRPSSSRIPSRRKSLTFACWSLWGWPAVSLSCRYVQPWLMP